MPCMRTDVSPAAMSVFFCVMATRHVGCVLLSRPCWLHSTYSGSSFFSSFLSFLGGIVSLDYKPIFTQLML